jgi:uncharacterized phage protein gp47/JayE
VEDLRYNTSRKYLYIIGYARFYTMLNKRISSQITQSAIRNLANNTDITFFGSGSIAKTIVESMAREIEGLYDSIDLNLSMARLSTAAGAFLDIIAAQFGLSRFAGTSGIILAEDRAVRFFTRNGRLIDYLPSTSSLTSGSISQGVTISTRDGSIIYSVSESITFPSSATSVFVPVTPVNPDNGSSNNVPSGALVLHSLGNANILVENVAPIIVGSDPETDEEFRLRISRHINASSHGSKTAVLSAAFSFPGISDVRIHPFKHGAGSFEILLVPTGTRISPNVLQNIKSALDGVVPYGIKVTVRGPNVVPIAIAAQIIVNRGLLNTIKTIAVDEAKIAIRKYLGDIRMGGELIVNQLRANILNSSNNIKDLRILQLIINCRPQVIANYRLLPDEVFGLDENIPNPIALI